MKLHLPKQLFTALLAAITLAAPAAWGASTAADFITIGGTVYGTDDDSANAEILTGTTTPNTGTKHDYVVVAGNRTAITSNVFAAGETIVIAAGSYTTTDGTTAEFSGGQLFINVYDTATTEITNDIILGGSGTDGGVLRLHETKEGKRIILSGRITVVNDTTIAVGGGGNDGRYNYLEGYINAENKSVTINHLNGNTSRVMLSGGGTFGTLAGNIKEIEFKSTHEDGTASESLNYTIGSLTTSAAITVDRGVTINLTGGDSQAAGCYLSVAEGAQFIVQENATLNIARTITGAGTLTNNGTLHISDATQLNGYTSTYTAGASGFRTGFTATLLEGTTLAGTGSLTFSGQVTGDSTSMDNGVLTVTFANNNGVYYINDAREYATASGIGDATSLEISSAGSLSVDLSAENTTVAAPKPIANSGALALSVGANAVNLNSLFGTNAISQTATGTTTIAGTGAISMDAALSVSGTIIIDGTGSLVNNSKKLSLNKLVLQDGASATFTGGATTITGDIDVYSGSTMTISNSADASGFVKGLVTVKDGGKLVFGAGDITGWNGGTNATRLNIESGGILELCHNSNESWKGTLNLSGTMQAGINTGTSAKYTPRWDLRGGTTILVAENATAEIDGVKLYLRDHSSVEVKTGATLTISGNNIEDNGTYTFTKTGAGELIFGRDVQFKVDNLSVSAGTLSVNQNAGFDTVTAITVSSGAVLNFNPAGTKEISNSISGDGALTKTGSGTLTLSGANTYTGGTTVQEGELIVSSAGSLGTGSVQLEAGSTLTLGASVTNAIQVNGAGANINLSSGVTLTHNGKVTINEGASINYTLDNAILNLSNTAITSGISIDMRNNSMVQLHTATNHLGGENTRVSIDMSGNSALSLKNGWEGNVWADIIVDGSGRILGSVSGNNAVVKGSIKGNGSLLLGRSDDTWSNAWKIESLISDNESGKLSVTFDATDGAEGPSKVTLSGANTYSGGTTIENGHLYTENASALGTGKVTVNAGGVLSVAANLKLQDTLQLSGAGKVQVATGKSLNLQDKVSLSSTDGTNAATMTAKADVNALAQLQEDASFTIEDMTLTNTTITAATPTTQVNFRNVTVAGATVLRNMQASMTSANVAAGGSDGVKGVFTASTSLLSGITLANTDAVGSTITVDLGDLSCAAPMGPGKYDLSITLSGFTMQDYTQGIVFAADSWLGQLLTAQGATAYVSGAVETPTSVSEGGSTGGVSVSYSAATGGNVGTVITITGLNVPEPASATLGLAALMMLCARRRRKA